MKKILGLMAVFAAASSLAPQQVFGQELPVESAPKMSKQLPFLREAAEGPVKLTYDYTNGQNGQGDGGTEAGGGDQSNGGANNVPKNPQDTRSGSDCPFVDLGNSKGKAVINQLHKDGVVYGKKPCYFEPKAEITRAEALTVVNRAAKKPLKKAVSKPFPDSKLSDWHVNEVATGKAEDVVHGYPDGLFRADQAINKVEAYKILSRAFGNWKLQVDSEKLSEIKDIDAGEWYAPYVESQLKTGVISSEVKILEPAGNVTREEFAIWVDLARRYYQE